MRRARARAEVRGRERRGEFARWISAAPGRTRQTVTDVCRICGGSATFLAWNFFAAFFGGVCRNLRLPSPPPPITSAMPPYYEESMQRDIDRLSDFPKANTDSEGQTSGNESSWADFLRCHRRSFVAAKQFCTDAWQTIAIQGSALSSFGTTRLKY